MQGCAVSYYERVGFRCSFRVGIVVLLVVRLEQRPQVGRATLLSARVRAYKPRHQERPDESPAFRLLTVNNKPEIRID